jgi:hypothetical protein
MADEWECLAPFYLGDDRKTYGPCRHINKASNMTCEDCKMPRPDHPEHVHVLTHKNATDPTCVYCGVHLMPQKPCGHHGWCACTKYREFPDEPVGKTTTVSISLTLHLRLPSVGDEGNGTEGRCRGLDRPDMGSDNPEWCRDPRHGEPCPFPCSTCATDCNPLYFV